MSRAYRIKVKESARHVLRASDHVSTQLDLMEILPPERMSELLTQELEKRGFTREGEKMIRREKDGVVVEVDTAKVTVTVKVETKKEVIVEGERQGWSNVEKGKQHQRDRENLRQEILKDLQRQADQRTAELQKEVTDQLESHLSDVRKELDQAINRVTADALKEKAAQIGHIKELSEDTQTGSLTIVLEV
jgi:hypothetical protein